MITILSENNMFKMTAQLDKGGSNGQDYFGYTRSNSEVVLEVIDPTYANLREYDFWYTCNGQTLKTVYSSDTNGRLVISMRKWMNLCGDCGNFSLWVWTYFGNLYEPLQHVMAFVVRKL